MDPPSLSPPSYEWAFVRVLGALAAVCTLAWYALRSLTRGGLMRGGGGHVEVLERVALDARQRLYLVRVGARVLLLGGGDGALATLATLSPDELPARPIGSPPPSDARTPSTGAP